MSPSKSWRWLGSSELSSVWSIRCTVPAELPVKLNFILCSCFEDISTKGKHQSDNSKN